MVASPAPIAALTVSSLNLKSRVLLDVNRLCIAVTLQATEAALVADTALLVSAKRRKRAVLLVAVDPDTTGLDLVRDAAGLLEVLGPHGGSETPFGIVGFLDHGVFVGPGDKGDDGTCRRLLVSDVAGLEYEDGTNRMAPL